MAENNKVYRTYVTFILRGKNLNPEYITEALGITPTRSYKRGDQRTGEKFWPHGLWSFSSQNNISSTDLSKHIEWILDRLEGSRSRLVDLLSENSFEAKLSCFWESQNGYGGIVISRHLLERITAMKLDFLIDIYRKEA
jgi:hypothetical protein